MGLKLKEIDNKVGDIKSPTFPIKSDNKVYNKHSDLLNKALLRENINPFIIDKKTFDNTLKRDKVLITKYMDEEELNKAKAENQSGVEQFGRMVTQAVTNEVVLGTALAFSNIVDFFANIARDEDLNDYTNPVSQQLETWQEQLRDRFEIYQKDPNASWAISDLGWWMNNGVSIASTASMLIPSTSIVKGISLAGKLPLGIGKTLTKGINKSALLAGKAAKHIGLGNSAARNMQAIKTGTEIGLTALASRTMEGYLEAREVYKEVEENTKQSLAKMSEIEFNEFIKNNPNFEGKNLDEIASHIASVSADKTFQNDYAMLLFDFIQLKGLNSMWKGLPNKAASATLRLENKKAIKSLLDDVVEEGKDVAKKQGWSPTRLDKIKEYINHPLSTIGAIEWSEGLEEAYQGIQTEKGKEVARMILDPNYTPRDITSYLADPKIWEQATWGILGGAGFKVVGTGLGNAYRYVRGKLDKTGYGANVDHLLTSEEKVRKEEIDSRQARLKQFSDYMEIINNGYHPEEYEKDGNNYTKVDEVRPLRKLKDENEKETLRRKYLHDFLTPLVTESMNVGNYELLKEYLTSPEFNKYLQNSGAISDSKEDADFMQYIIDYMDTVADSYSVNLYNILANTEVEHESIARLAASQLVRDEITINEYNKQIDSITADINKLHSEANTKIDAYRRKRALEEIEQAKLFAELSVSNAESMYESGKISLHAKDKYIREAQDLLDGLERYKTELGIISENENTNEDSNFGLDTNLMQLLNDKVHIELQKAIVASRNPKNKKDEHKAYLQLAKDIQDTIDTTIEHRLNKASEKVEKWIYQQKDVDKAKKDLYEDNVPELRKELSILKLGHHSSKQFTQVIDATIEDRRKQLNKENIATDGQNPVPEQEIQNQEEQANQLENSVNNQTTLPVEVTPSTSDSPTGEESKALTAIIAEKVTEALDVNRDYDSKDEFFNDLVDIVYRNLLAEVTGYDFEKDYIKQEVDNILTQIGYVFGDKSVSNDDIENRIKREFLIINSGVDIRESITKTLSSEELDKVIDEALKKYIQIKNISIKHNGKYVINLEELFKYIITDRKIDVDTAVHILYNMKDFLASSRHNYIFNQRRSLNSILKNPLNFINDLINERMEIVNIDTHMHVSAPSKNNRHESYQSTINSLKEGDELEIMSYGEVDGNHSDTTMDVRKDGVPIGYIAKVNANDTNTTYSLQEADNSTPLRYVVTKESETKYSANTDKLFKSFFENEDLLDILNKYFIASLENKDWVATEEETKLILENEAVKEAIKNGTIVFNFAYLNSPNKHDVPETVEQRKAKLIINALKNIAFYDKSAQSVQELINSYKKWVEKLYKNYENTHRIQNAVGKGTLKIKYSGSGGNNRTQKTGMIITDEERNITDESLGLYADLYSIVAIGRDEKGNTVIKSERAGDEEHFNKTAFRTGSMGFRVGGRGGNPHIVLFSSPNKVNGDIKNGISEELTELITSYQSGRINFEELQDAFTDLFKTRGSDKDNLFYGIKLFIKDGRIHINKIVEDESGVKKTVLLATIHKYEKDGSLGTNIYHAPNGDTSRTITFSKFSKAQVKSLVDDIVGNVYYNASFYTLNHKNDSDDKSNRYFYKENGEFVVSIGNKTKRYSNFGQFVLDNNAFNTKNAKVNGSFFKNTDNIKSIYIDVDLAVSPETRVSATTSVEDMIRSAKDAPQSTRELLKTAGMDDTTIDFLLGKTNGIDLIPEEYYYDDKETKSTGLYKNGKIHFTNGAINDIRNHPISALRRILIHEKLHDKFNKADLFKRKQIVEDLIDTYYEFIKGLNKYLDSDKISPTTKELFQKVKHHLESGYINPKTYFEHGSKERINNYKKLTQEERDRIFAEEWLVECLTQGPLMDALNQIEYTKGSAIVDGITKDKKSIWQKIIDALLKLFNVFSGNIKNNTIFARQYLILGEQYDTIVDENSDDINIEEAEENVDNQVTNDEKEYRINTFKNRNRLSPKKDNNDRRSITNTLETYIDNIADNDGNAIAETFGVTRISDMNDYINTFPIQEQPLIAEMLKNGKIEWVCR